MNFLKKLFNRSKVQSNEEAAHIEQPIAKTGVIHTDSFWLIAATMILSGTVWYLFYTTGLTLIYNDAMAHLNISRLIVDNAEPGFSQLGSVWLPMSHILPLAFIWNDWAWQSGFAGSIISMISYVAAAWAAYSTVFLLTKKRLAAVAGLAVFALNLNMLYLQSTPLTESLYVGFFMLSVYFFAKYLITQNQTQLLMIGLLGFFQVLTRYDGWFVVGIEGLLIVLFELSQKRRNIHEIVGKCLLFGFPIAFGIFIWLLWNLLIFNDPLYFALGPYSARAQQQTIEHNTGLITKGNWVMSGLAYWYAVIANNGTVLTIFTAVSSAILLLTKKIRLNLVQKLLIIVFLAGPILFNILALFLGFSVLNVPALNWSPSGDLAEKWFNARYGILALPLMAIVIGLAASWKKFFAFLAIAVVLVQMYIMATFSDTITITDGLIGSSSYQQQDLGAILSNSVKPGEKIIMSTSYFSPVAFKSGVDLKQVIHEGVSKVWPYAVTTPEKQATWLVMANGDVGEPLYTSLVKNQHNRFLTFYALYHEGRHANIYRLKEEKELFIRRDGKQLLVGDKPYTIKGVNSYDLAYREDNEIRQTFADLSQAGVNTVRFWMFGNGEESGFQPKAGITNPDRFKKVDLIITQAQQYNIKLIPVLENNWEDFGGKLQYMEWTGKINWNADQFYTDLDIRNLYKNYANKVMNNQNTLTGRVYKDEPAILAWDLMNEPRSAKNTDGVLKTWVTEMSDYIHSIDQNHLITVDSDPTGIYKTINDNNHLCSAAAVDICSVHMYFEHNDENIYPDQFSAFDQLQKYVTYSSKLEKPIIMGEIGVSKETKPLGQEPLPLLTKTIQKSATQGYSGYLIWNYAQKTDDSFGFSPNGDETGHYSLNDLKSMVNSEPKL